MEDGHEVYPFDQVKTKVQENPSSGLLKHLSYCNSNGQFKWNSDVIIYYFI